MGESRACSALPFVLALPIFPVRLQTSIFGAGELNFRVRDGNGWTLTAINTNLLFLERKSKQKELCAGSLATSVGHSHFENLFGIFCAILTNGTLSSQRPAIRSVFYLASSSRNRVLRACTLKTEQSKPSGWEQVPA